MKLRKLWTAGALGIALATTSLTPAFAQTLTIMKGATNQPLNVPMNRAVVLESDTPFAELSVANPGIADISTLSDRTIYVLGITPGRTTMTLLTQDGKLISNVEVHVTPDIEEFKERLQQILPGEGIEVRTANDGIVLSGTVSSTAKLDRALDLANRYSPDKVSNLMQVAGTQQVMLKVRFAEMQRSVSKSLSSSLGVRGGTNIGVGGATGTLADGVNPGKVSLQNGTRGALGLGFTAGSLEFGVLLEALESKGVVRTLAEPNLTAISGESATFIAGGEFPIPAGYSCDPVTHVCTTQIQYKKFGISLNFTPVVLSEGRISLRVMTEVSELSNENAITLNQGGSSLTVPSIRTRRAETTLEIPSGGSMAMAGLIQQQTKQAVNGLPGVNQLPILGALFRSQDFVNNETELMVLVTPYVVRAVAQKELSRPDDGFAPASDSQSTLLARINRIYGLVARVGPVGAYEGNFGFIID